MILIVAASLLTNERDQAIQQQLDELIAIRTILEKTNQAQTEQATNEPAILVEEGK